MQELKNIYKIIIALVSAAAVIAVSIYCTINGIEIIYPHLYYIPIAILVFWYGKKGWYIVFPLSSTLILIDIIFGMSEFIVNDLLRAVIMCTAGGILSVPVERYRKMVKKKEETSSKTLQDILDASPDIMILRIDKKLKIKWANKAAREKDPDAIRKTCYEAFLGSKKPCKSCPVKKAMDTGEVKIGKVYHSIVKGAEGGRYWQSIGIPVRDEDGVIKEAVEIIRDITGQKEAEYKLAKEKELKSSILQSSPAYVTIIDKDGKLSMMNDSMLDALGYRSEEVRGADYVEKFVPEGNRAMLSEVFKELRNGKSTFNENKILTKDNRELSVEWCGKPIFNDKREFDFLIGIGIDITKKKAAESRLKYLSFHDNMTGLSNRAYVEEEIARLDTDREYPLSIIMGDINALKLVNDAFGYENGDRLIMKVADIFRECFRGEDIVGRWGGDEFLAIVPKISEEEVTNLVKRIKDKCKKSTFKSLPVSISLGSSTKYNKNVDINSILKEAEERMYQNKLTETRSIQSSLISLLETTLWERSHETKEHAKRIKKMALEIGEKIKLPQNSLDELSLLSTLHDIGKIAVPDSILTKKGSLTEKEWGTMKKHAEIGYKIAQSSPQLLKIADSILYHHEWWDGTGYPRGLKGKDIPLNSRIVLIVDAYDVMTHNRVYRKAISGRKAIAEIKRNSGRQFDPELVEIFVKTIGEEKIKNQ
jgi:diguanylate cyclase (GGDEF)-like protein/PAS domain S-box-containing protein